MGSLLYAAELPQQLTRLVHVLAAANLCAPLALPRLPDLKGPLGHGPDLAVEVAQVHRSPEDVPAEEGELVEPDLLAPDVDSHLFLTEGGLWWPVVVSTAAATFIAVRAAGDRFNRKIEA